MRNFEHERKFLVRDDAILEGSEGTSIIQGYFEAPELDFSIRIRYYPALEGDVYTMTVKGPRKDISRAEEELPVTAAFGELALLACGSHLIEKVRYSIVADVYGETNKCWDVDKFTGPNLGLILAELELKHPSDNIELPDWCGQEVTDDPRYYNDYLMKHPYTTWDEAEGQDN